MEYFMRNVEQKENWQEDDENDETPELVIKDICDKSEGEVKETSNEDDVTVTFQVILDTWSATKNDSTDKIDTVMELMITKDQEIVFCEDYCKLEEGNDVTKTY